MPPMHLISEGLVDMKPSTNLAVLAVAIFLIALVIQLFAFGDMSVLRVVTSIILAVALVVFLSLLVGAMKAR